MSNVSVLAASLMTYALAYAGMTAFCLGMEKHYAQARDGAVLSPASRKWLKAIGWSLLALGILSSAYGWGWSIGLVAWTGFVSAAAISLVLLLSYSPNLLTKAGVSVAGIGLLALLVMVID
ncbi:DUF3325 domain-containing protein [Methylobacillus arboreus]|uniref:DUF3325 domain-containing protein n=1 Tax=Methylobacillus arboreus TaxID=755170 RepID=UPI001E519B57|nr:DUF3325 domain-containing protein [Methylobacillus arboreus]MCB5190026.1 DUF3325 domain-containing protein [Methylobacillus arboreus]